MSVSKKGDTMKKTSLDKYKLEYEELKATPQFQVVKKKVGRKPRWVEQPENILENVE